MQQKEENSLQISGNEIENFDENVELNIRRLLLEYLLDGIEESFIKLVNSKRLYVSILVLLKRNGIDRKKFSFDDFPVLLYFALQADKNRLVIFLDREETYFIIVSRLTNCILKQLNRDIYKERKNSEKEVFCEELMANSSYDTFLLDNPDVDRDLFMSKIGELNRLIEEEKDYKNKLVYKIYFGIDRPYRLGIDDIMKILNIKRSTAFNKLKKAKMLLAIGKENK